MDETSSSSSSARSDESIDRWMKPVVVVEIVVVVLPPSRSSTCDDRGPPTADRTRRVHARAHARTHPDRRTIGPTDRRKDRRGLVCTVRERYVNQILYPKSSDITCPMISDFISDTRDLAAARGRRRTLTCFDGSHTIHATSTRDDVTRLSEPGVSRCVRARVTKKVGWVWKVWVANGPIGSGKNVESSTAVEKPTNHPRAGAGG